MKKNQLTLIGFLFVVSNACQLTDNAIFQEESKIADQIPKKIEELKQDYAVDGEYTYEDGGMRASLTINGEKWRASTYYKTDKGSKFDSSHVEYKTGIIKDKMLYENSGIIPIRPVERNKIKMNLGGKEVDLVKLK
jgi:hypothetical protein